MTPFLNHLNATLKELENVVIYSFAKVVTFAGSLDWIAFTTFVSSMKGGNFSRIMEQKLQTE